MEDMSFPSFFLDALKYDVAFRDSQKIIEKGLQDACHAIHCEWGCDTYCGEHCSIFRAISEIVGEE